MSNRRIFRKVALDRLASPEQLDQILQVTSRRGWLALAAIALLLVTAVVWGIFGVLSEKVVGHGILLRSGGVLEVVATASGRINDISVTVGDTIAQGQVVARVEQPDLMEELERAKEKLAVLRLEHREKIAFVAEQRELDRARLRQRREDFEQAIAAGEERLRVLEERLAAQRSLVESGLLARPTLLATRQLYDQTQEKIRARETDLAALDVEELELENRAEETVRGGELEIERAEAAVDQVERRLGVSSRIVSRYGGRVLELMTEQGKIVQRGEPVLSLDLAGAAVQDLVGVVYVPSLHGKKVEPGMTIHVAPSTVPQEEFGMMVGRVIFVSDFPATTRGMVRVLKNDQLVRELSGGGAPYEVHAELFVDPTTPSQYRWTSSSGPATRIESGTVATGYISIEEQRPISRVLPLLRRWTGVS